MTQLQVQQMTNAEINWYLAGLMGKKVVEFDGNVYVREEFSEGSARYFPIPDYCTEPAASLKVQAKALDVDAGLYLKILSSLVYGTTYEKVQEYDLIALIEVKHLLTSTHRQMAEAAYMTLQAYQVDKQ